MSADLEDMVADYLLLRRALGYKLKDNEHILVQFVAYLRAHDAQAVTVEHALGYATASTGRRLAGRRCGCPRSGALPDGL